MINSEIEITVPDQNYGAILFNVFKKSAIPVFRVESELLAERMVKDLKRRLRKQLFNFTPLNPKYKDRKIKYGYDPRILFASGQYYRSITVVKTEYGAKIGVKDIDHYPNPMKEDWKRQQTNMRRRNRRSIAKGQGSLPQTIPMVELAKMLEYGTTRAKIGRGGPRMNQPWYMPPRPHWRPVIAKFRREQNIIKKNFTNAMTAAVKNALQTEMLNQRTRQVRLTK
jgi:hypothetical protein